MKQILIVLIIGSFLFYLYHRSQPVSLGDGVKATNEPIQKTIDKGIPFRYNEFKITPLADFQINAKVILKKDYSYDTEAELSPTDLALGWGRMSDEAVLSKLSISQSGRWYRYRYKNAPIPQKEIQTHSANMHLIPADDNVAKIIKAVKAGQIIEIDGQLVEAENTETKWTWKSSLTRNDTGGGACELIFVKALRIVEGS